MKTAEEILKESYPELYEDKTTFLTAFKMYISAMETYANQSKWISVETEKPTAYRSGNWDGLRSDFVLVIDNEGKTHVAEMYEGYLDGSYFFEFYNDRDFEVPNITHWQPLPEKP